MSDLITLDDYKEYKSIKNPEREGKIQSLITRSSAFIEHYCNRTFLDYASSPGVTEWFDAKTNKVILSHFPVISVVSVSTSTDGGLNQTALTENDSTGAGYFVDLDEGAVLTQNQNYNFLDSYSVPYRSLEVTYYAGYTETPEDLKLAVIDLIAYYLEDESQPTKSMLGATIDNPLPYVGVSLPANIRRVLDLYRYSD